MEQESIILPSSLKVIEAGAFKNRGDIRNIVIPDSVEEIGEDAFAGSSVEEIVFPRELRKLGRMNGHYYDLRKLDFSKVRHLEEFPSDFLSPDTLLLTELALPMGVKKVGACLGGWLKKLFLPSTVQEIDDEFHQEDIDVYCFSPKLKRLEPLVKYYDYDDEACHFYVLPEYLEAYKAQQEAEGVSTDYLIIGEMPEEYQHYYDE